jgi:hypothetical protein
LAARAVIITQAEGEQVERQGVAADGDQAGKGKGEAVGGFEGRGADYFGHDGKSEIEVSEIQGHGQ